MLQPLPTVPVQLIKDSMDTSAFLFQRKAVHGPFKVLKSYWCVEFLAAMS